MGRIDEPSEGVKREREAARWENWDLVLIVTAIVGAPLLVLAGFLVPGLGIVSIPVAIGFVVARWLLVRGTIPPSRAEWGLAIGTGAIVAAFFAYFGERIAILLLLLVFGAS